MINNENTFAFDYMTVKLFRSESTITNNFEFHKKNIFYSLLYICNSNYQWGHI